MELAIPLISPAQININNIQEKRPKTSGNICNNNFKVVTTPNTATLEYYQSIYTYCKQRFNIPDGIEVVKKSVYQYIENHINNYLFGNYNILEVRNNLYNNLIETLATYFQELNFNIIEYCKEKYPVQSQYSIDFESETKTSNKGKQKLKQYSRTTPNIPILQKTTAQHFVKLPLSITPFPISLAQPQIPSLLLNHFSRPEDFYANIIDYLQENESNHSESLESEETESEQEETTENKEEITTAYIAKIPEFTSENNDTSPQEWLDKFENLGELFENWQAFKDAFLQQFTNNNTSITLHNHFHNIKQETSETFIAGLKDKLIKKVRPHAPENLATAIKYIKNYKMAMEEANHTKLVNLAIEETTTSQTNNNSNNNHKNINLYNNATKTILDHHPTTNLKIVIIVEFQDTGNEIAGNYKETNKTGVINVTLYHNNFITNPHHQLITHQDHKIKTITINQLHNQCNNNISSLYQISNIKHHPLNNIKYQPEDWSNKTNSHHKTFHIQPSYLTMQEELNFQQTALSENIFPFEFKANKSSFLLSNAAANKQKAITAMYTEATLMQQLQRTVDRPAQTIIVTADGMKKIPVGEIDNFSFTIDGITISVKVLVMDAPQYQALVGNDWLLKTNANLDWETQELKISYQGQYIIEKEMPLTETYMALGSTFNWAEKIEQKIFEESRE
ncbi:hypothetical protein G9A89_003744 [Geosiphon pyriformis]|nr:hypothetical protein G9A89_003744 [Geosiphon pyriformis]